MIPTVPEPTECRSCRAKVIFVVGLSGKTQILDAEPERRYRLIVGTNGVTQARLEEVYRSHFQTCPQGDQWRKPAGREGE